jgi:ubiquinone/menaquinone biosynthesis C-methylase UbiE
MMKPKRQGWHGWDEYARFYDWENARTFGRRDVSFWRRVARRTSGRILELGCGTGRILKPLTRDGLDIVGIDRSAAMLARTRGRRRGTSAGQLRVVRGDVRALPFADARFSLVLAPYGILQSLLRDPDLVATLSSVARVLEAGGLFGIDLVPDVPNWKEYRRKVQMRGRGAGGAHLTLIESVRQERDKHLTTFEQCYLERRGRSTAEHRFELTFRTPPMRSMIRRIEKAGFTVETMLGDYRGGPWDERADAWILLARRVL